MRHSVEMRALYLSAAVSLKDVPARGASDLSETYRTAYEGVVDLCVKHGWRVHHSSGAGDRAEGWLRGSDAFVAIRFAHMATALMPGWELANAAGKTPSGEDRQVIVFKLEATTEFDEFWVGKPGTSEVVGDAQKLLEQVEQMLCAGSAA